MSPEHYVVDFSDMVVVYVGTIERRQRVVAESSAELTIITSDQRSRYWEDLRDCIV